MHTSEPDIARRRALAALVAVQMLFGAFPVIGKLAMSEFGAGGVALLRMAGACAIFALIARATGARPVPWRVQPRLALLSLLGISGNQLLFLHGLERTSATHAALLTTTIPVQTLLAAAILGRERLVASRTVGVALALAGAAILVLRRDGAGAHSVSGDLMVFANAGLYSFYLVLGRDLLREHAPLAVLPWLFFWGLVVSAPITGLPPVAEASPTAWAAAAFVVLGPTVGSYWLNLYALRVVPASVVALFIYLQPLLAAALAVPVLGERPDARTAFAATLTFAGVWLATRAGQKETQRHG